jgi:hypothetical protein
MIEQFISNIKRLINLEWRVYKDTLYIVSEYGDIVNLSRDKTRILKHSINPKGYHIASLSKGNHRYEIVGVHVMVAEVFLTKSSCNLEVHHKDKNLGNNHYSNLEWITHSENILKAYPPKLNIKIKRPKIKRPTISECLALFP